MKRLKEVLNQEESHSVMPFFWQHGESEDVLCGYMEQIRYSGCHGVCIEARPHPNFAQEQWWKDVGRIVEKAKENQMEIWILDDSHFPTGYANGLVAQKYPHLLKRYLDCRRFDVVGPISYARLNLRFLKGKPWEQKGRENDRILGIYGARRAEEGEGTDPILTDTLVDLTKKEEDGILYWDIPDGAWSVFVMIETRMGGEETTKDYLNPLVKEAAEVLIEAVYEPHYKHFKEEFGTTITAFFSDEPRFGNAKGTDKIIGKAEMVLPWCEKLEEKLPFQPILLPLLFADSADSSMSRVRYEYMDCISRMYSENFTQVLGAWCEAHNVKYVGHHIEDNGAHMRLGYGAGHLFRAQKGQSFSGIDVISNQIAPGYAFHHDAFATGGHDGVFYHYALGHLGASIAQTDPKKNGIAMCEAFGAYGWNEGLKWMKWITDHLLVRGINYFVPHAFNPKKYPDWDCPPHFYAHGNNPQYRYFPILIRYMQRMCHLLQGGIHEAPVAVLYTAEGEWGGSIQPIEQILRELDKNQIEMTIVPLDAIKVCGKNKAVFQVNQNEYRCLIVPAMERVPFEMAEELLELCKTRIPVLFVEAYPSEVTGSGEGEVLLEKLKAQTLCTSKKEIIRECSRWKVLDTSEYQPNLTTYHYVQPDGEIYMLFNEHTSNGVNTELTIRTDMEPVCFDAFKNQLQTLAYKRTDGCVRVHLCLDPYESKVILLRKVWDDCEVHLHWNGVLEEKAVLEGPWELSFADAKSYLKDSDEERFVRLGIRNTLAPISNEKEFRDKTGTLRYKKTFHWRRQSGRHVFLNLGKVYEIAEIFVNGRSVGVRICPPYRVEITNFLVDGENELEIEVTNTLGNENKEFMSQYTPIEPFGLLGPVNVETEREGTERW